MSSDEASLSSEFEIMSQETQKAKEKSKKSKSSAVMTPHERFERTDRTSTYKPPEGYAIAEHRGDAGEFDWDALADNDDLELWVVRIPEGIKPKHLQGLKLDVPSSSKTARIGSLARKHTTYDVWSLGQNSHETVGAEEVKNFSCMVPRQKSAGNLFPVPKITTRHIVLSAQSPSPSVSIPEGDNADMSWSTGQNPPRPSYPKELLKHRFMPYGSLAPPRDDASAMNIDSERSVPVTASRAPEGEIAVKPKRRKAEGEGAKKSKKARTVKE